MTDKAKSVSACGGYFLKAADGYLAGGPLPCKRWDCENPECAPAKLKYYYAVLCNGMGVSGPGHGKKSDDIQLLTLTTDPKKWPSKEAAWDGVGKTFHKFIKRLRYHYGSFEYAAVTEATKQGYPHVHVITRGLPEVPQGWHEEYKNAQTGEWERVTRQEQKQGAQYRILRYADPAGRETLSEMAGGAGFGWVVDIRSVQADTDKGAANYLLGYLEKSLSSKHYPPNFRRVHYSRGWLSSAWERVEKREGVGLHFANKTDYEFTKAYIARAESMGYAPEGIISQIQALGVTGWLSGRLGEWVEFANSRTLAV